MKNRPAIIALKVNNRPITQSRTNRGRRSSLRYRKESLLILPSSGEINAVCRISFTKRRPLANGRQRRRLKKLPMTQQRQLITTRSAGKRIPTTRCSTCAIGSGQTTTSQSVVPEAEGRLINLHRRHRPTVTTKSVNHPPVMQPFLLLLVPNRAPLLLAAQVMTQ